MISLIVYYGLPLMTMDAVSATIVSGARARIRMDYFPGQSFFQTRCTTIDVQLLYNFVNKKISILHYLSISYVGIVQI